MPHVITEDCIRCKYMECVTVCPVDCFHEGENMLVIDPGACIDCGVCASACPVEAIVSDWEAGDGEWTAINAEYARKWPKITHPRAVTADADDWHDVPGKRFIRSPDPGRGS